MVHTPQFYGLPLTHHITVTTLLPANFDIAISIMDEYTPRNTRFGIVWVRIDLTFASQHDLQLALVYQTHEANSTTRKAKVIGLVTTRLRRAFGSTHGTDLIAYRDRTLFHLNSKVFNVIYLFSAGLSNSFDNLLLWSRMGSTLVLTGVFYK